MYFWTTIRKNRSKYNLTRGIAEDDVTSILLRSVIVDKDLQKAEGALLELPGLKKYVALLQTDREKEDFRRHMRKYINIWQCDCPFEVSTTNRYTIVTYEAAVTARRPIRKGETIKYLCGNLVAMTPDEEKDLDLTRRDFSIVMSSRKKTPSLFLGPARFANHDCNANAKLVTRGSEGMQVVAVRDIELGDEITVNYGENYFGDDNCECLCGSCESLERGGWPGEEDNADSSRLSTPPDLDAEPEPVPELEPEHELAPDVPETTHFPEIVELEPQSDLSSLTTLASDSDDWEESPKKKRKISVDRVENVPSSFGIEVLEDAALSPTINSPKRRSPLRKVLNIDDIVIDAEATGSSPGHEISLKEAGHHSNTTQREDEVLAEVRAAFANNTVKRPSSRRSEGKYAAQNNKPPARSNSDACVPFRFSSPFSFLTGLASSKPSKNYRKSFLRDKTSDSSGSRKPSSGSSSLSSSKGLSFFGIKDSVFDSDSKQKTSPATTPTRSFKTGIIDWDTYKVPVAAPAIDWNTYSGLRGSSFSSALSSALSTPLSSLSSVNSLSSIAEVDDATMTVRPKPKATPRKRGRPRKYPQPNGTEPKYRVHKLAAKPRLPRKRRVFQQSIEVEIPSIRTPGDYIRTHLLLGESFSRWVDCRTCDACWVQANGYQTRKECPRCERHSKLYGYQWPKTEKSGKNDDEERVMDHRTVHRFLPPDEEALEKKRGRGIVRLGLEGSERSESTGDDSSERTDSRARAVGEKKMREVSRVAYTR